MCAEKVRLDATWLWVNGSDAGWQQERMHWAEVEGVMSPDHHYRESDELRYSMRSAQGIFESYHLVLADHARPPHWLQDVPITTHSALLDEQYLPTFQSNVIESGLHNIPGLSPVSVAFNDDFFILQPLKTTDFYLGGPVFRFDPNYYQQVRLYDKNLVSDSGEQGSLRHANEILSRRFSRRFRPYLSHGPRVVVKHIHQEVAAAFAEDLHVARKRRFRESRHGEGSISYHWLCASYQVERWREALLWGFIVARLGTESDPDRVLEAVWSTKECQPTFEDFISIRGHLPPLLLPGQRKPGCPSFEQCFQSTGVALFKDVAWGNVRCGDCLIRRLVCAGPGLSAVLPKKTSGKQVSTAMLPLERHGDFSLGPENPRQFVLRLLQRYAYSTAPMNNRFISLDSPINLAERLESIDSATAALNDDAYTNYSEISTILLDWMQKRFPRKAKWEK